tara:strand:- start:113 stop:1072 length:960 start_codon:yes stop_codon:yes gene_type:complete
MNLSDFTEINTITSLDGEKLCYRTLGNPMSQPVVLLHGHSMDSKLCLPFAWPFSEKYFFIMPDIRGFGASSSYMENSEDILSVLAADLEQVLTTCGVGKCKFVGFSLGTMVLMQYMKDFGSDRVESSLFVDHSMKPLNTPGRTTGFCPDSQKKGLHEQMVQIFRSEMGMNKNGRWHYRRDDDFENMSSKFKKMFEEISKETILSAISPQFSAVLGIAQNKYFRKLNPMYNAWYFTMLLLSSYIDNQYDFKRFLRDTDIPYDVIWGSQTKMFGPDALRDYEDIQGFNKGEIIKFDSGHDLFYTDYPSFLRSYKKFLDKNI